MWWFRHVNSEIREQTDIQTYIHVYCNTSHIGNKTSLCSAFYGGHKRDTARLSCCGAVAAGRRPCSNRWPKVKNPHGSLWQMTKTVTEYLMSCGPTETNLQTLSGETHGHTDRRANGRTDAQRCIVPAAHTIRAVPITFTMMPMMS